MREELSPATSPREFQRTTSSIGKRAAALKLLDELLVTGANRESPDAGNWLSRPAPLMKSLSFSYRRSDPGQDRPLSIGKSVSMNPRGIVPRLSLSLSNSRRQKQEFASSSLTASSVPEDDNEGLDDTSSPKHGRPDAAEGSCGQDVTLLQDDELNEDSSEAQATSPRPAVKTPRSFGPSRLQRMTSASNEELSTCGSVLSPMESAALAAIAAVDHESSGSDEDSRPKPQREAADSARSNPWAPLPGPCMEAHHRLHVEPPRLRSLDSLKARAA